jgi:hypothetical protein
MRTVEGLSRPRSWLPASGRLLAQSAVKRFAVLAIALIVAGAVIQGSESLKAIVDSYVTIQSQLAADKIDDVKAPARAIAAQAATMGSAGLDIAKAASSLERASDLTSARDAFSTLTEAVMAAGKAEGWKDVEGVRLAFCPMVKRSWLQKEGQIRNPYYGTSMATCGEFKKLTD